MLAAPILALVVVFLLIAAHQLRSPGGVRLVAGVKEPSVLKTPQALAKWTANISRVLAAIISCAAVALLFVPERSYSLVFLPLIAAVVLTVVVGVVGAQSRRRTNSG